jgi:hypothetical protein
MIGYLKERITGGGKPKYTRAQIISARPFRNPAVTYERSVKTEDTPSLTLLRIPRRRDRWGDTVARLFRLPDHRKLELDEIGSDVWEMCDGALTVETITKAICLKYRLNRRQGETSVTAYLRQLAERRLVALRAAGNPGVKKSAVRAAVGKQKRA